MYDLFLKGVDLGVNLVKDNIGDIIKISLGVFFALILNNYIYGSKKDE